MKLSKILAGEVTRSHGAMVIRPVPPEKQPSYEEYKRIQRDIAAQVRVNEAMCSRSMGYTARYMSK